MQHANQDWVYELCFIIKNKFKTSTSCTDMVWGTAKHLNLFLNSALHESLQAMAIIVWTIDAK